MSVAAERVPTGPAIILSLTAFALLSILFAPRRGVVPDALRRRRRGLVAPVDGAADGVGNAGTDGDVDIAPQAIP